MRPVAGATLSMRGSDLPSRLASPSRTASLGSAGESVVAPRFKNFEIDPFASLSLAARTTTVFIVGTMRHGDELHAG